LVRITATSRTPADRALIAYGVFRADESGNIDLGSATPIEGTYSKPDSMGLFWSMTPQAVPVEVWRHLELSPRHPPQPWNVLLEVAPEQGGDVLASVKVVRLTASEGVRSVDVRDDGLIAQLMLPAHVVSHGVPGIILLGGSEGGLDDAGAALLASHGYAALALAYFGSEGTSPELVEIPVEYSLKALRWLQTRSEIDPGRIAIIARSRGSELALLIASLRPEIRSVIAVGPSSVVWGGIPKSPRPTPVSAWTYEGKALPFLSANAPPDLTQEFFAKGPLKSRLYDFLFSDQEKVERATLPVEGIQGKVLLISGKEDRVWGSPIMAERILDRARRFGRASLFQSISYDDAGHNIREPYRPVFGQARLGGTAEGHALAEQDSWQKILAFLGATLNDR
jgi:dienelactone hydrolase